MRLAGPALFQLLILLGAIWLVGRRSADPSTNSADQIRNRSMSSIGW
jgi:hypothetical protein